MNIKLFLVGKTEEKYLQEGIALYLKKLVHYASIAVIELKCPINKGSLPVKELQKKEGTLLLQNLNESDRVFLLDENGTQYDSLQMASFIQKQQNSSVKSLVFIVGGAYGFSDDLYKRANGKISLSKMTFSHQMVRLIFLEQLYRAFTINRGEKYHHL